METYRIEHYIVEVETDGKKPGETVNITIQSERQNAKYKSVYGLVWLSRMMRLIWPAGHSHITRWEPVPTAKT